MRGCDERPTACRLRKGAFPLIYVSWDQAKAYVAWLSRMTGKPYRLLTEAEWEYAARGVTSADAPQPPYPWGDKASHEYANYGTDLCCQGKTEGRDKWLYTAPVGQFPANAFGLHDMHGNVFEWVEDADQVGRVGHVAIVQHEPRILNMGILIDVLDAPRIVNVRSGA